MGKENKKCLYIQKENLDYLLVFAQNLRKKTMSNALNLIIDGARQGKMFIKPEDVNYKNVTISIHEDLIEIMELLKNNFNSDAVIHLVNQRLMEEFLLQVKGKRKKFPDRLYSGWDYLKKLAEKLHKLK